MNLFELDPDLLVRLLLAIIYGGALGLEREASGRAAGLRTVILVCLGSTVITIISVSVPAGVDGELARDIVRMDPGRISAGIVTGVGFLGGAVVIKLGDLVRGVTTAATIWFAAALGIAIGQGHYALATWATVSGLLVLTGLATLGRSVRAPVYRRVWIGVKGDMQEQSKAIESVLMEMGARVMDLHATLDRHTGHTELLFHVRSVQSLQAPAVVARLSELSGVERVRWG